MSGAHHQRYVLRPEWARSVRDQMPGSGHGVLSKQWGGLHSKAGGKVLDGREWCEFQLQRGAGG